jgi:hypothetical protein
MYAIYIPRVTGTGRVYVQKYHTVGVVSKSNSKIGERDKWIPPTYKYMTAHFVGFKNK